MPMTFPSHQGLIAPLWRRWPGRFDIAALCVGAAMPDVVDGLIGIVRGHFGQGFGHSLLGMIVVCIPAGLLIRKSLCRVARRLGPSLHGGLWAFIWNRGVACLANGQATAGRIIVGSLAVGAFSPLLFDLVSHGHFPWLLPWVPKLAVYPDWWNDTWMRIWLPWRPAGRKIGPHAAIWVLLSVWGAWMLFKPAVQEWRIKTGKQKGGPSLKLEYRSPAPDYIDAVSPKT